MTTQTPRVVDISHHNIVKDFALVAAAGIWGVIHKASQGRAYGDPDYAMRRKAAVNAGLLWGAYHFNTGDAVDLQIDNFMRAAQPDDRTLMVLDFEDNRPSNMTAQQAVEFLHVLEARLGRRGAIYSGNRLKESIAGLGPQDRAYLTSHRLWLCQYGPTPHLPTGFDAWWLWQYTGDGIGPLPHNVPGIVAGNGGIDLNAYQGERDELVASWA